MFLNAYTYIYIYIYNFVLHVKLYFKDYSNFTCAL